MAGDWIKIEHATPDKPEVHLMADSLGVEPEHVVGCLIRLWVWVDQHSYDGSVEVTDAVIDRVARLTGFAEAIRAAKWLDAERIPHFDRHNGSTAKQRASTQKRVQKHRADTVSGNAPVTPSKHARVSIPRPLRASVYERDGETCVYCGRKKGEYAPPQETSDDGLLSLDHVIPCSRGGDETLNNLVTCCMCCNLHKGDRTPDEAGFPWPVDANGKRYGSVTDALPREEKRREEKEEVRSSKSSRFTAPSIDDVKAYCSERKNAVDPQAFVDFYASKGWKVGTSPMKDWKAAVRTWEKRETANGQKHQQAYSAPDADSGDMPWTR